MNKKTKEISTVAMLAVVIMISGMFKIPGIIPGTEFQLSAPISIAICACFGFRRYFLCGIVASFLSLALGMATVLNVAVALTFRIVGGILVCVGRRRMPVVVLAGPVGTGVARVLMSVLTGMPLPALLVAAAPGMLYTAVTAYPIYRGMHKLLLPLELDMLPVPTRKLF